MSLGAMQPFKLTLSNDATITGLHNFPPTTPSLNQPKYCSLLVCLHGAGYSAQYFDVDNKQHTASSLSNSLGVPVVAIDRPGYQGSTSFYPIPEGSSYVHESGRLLHRFILPTLWREYGRPHSCNSIVLHCHSLGMPGAIVAAGMHAQEQRESGTEETDNISSPSYPLAGISTSGCGSQIKQGGPPPQPPPAAAVPEEAPNKKPPTTAPSRPTTLFRSPSAKDRIMLGPKSANLVSPEIYALNATLDNPRPADEIADIRAVWIPQWRALASQVTVPVMIGLAGEDGLWYGTREHLEELVDGFKRGSSERVDGSLVVGAPHCMEMSHWAPGWYARVFGFAVECAVSFAVKERLKKMEEGGEGSV